MKKYHFVIATEGDRDLCCLNSNAAPCINRLDRRLFGFIEAERIADEYIAKPQRPQTRIEKKLGIAVKPKSVRIGWANVPG